jgi:DNA polymerase I-like protein with 3'-5' exonuclease and polymerase domains
MTGLDEQEAQEILAQYDRELPFVRQASDRYSRIAAANGIIELIDGARNHFNLLEPVFRDYSLEYDHKRKNPSISVAPCSQEEYEQRRNDPDHPWHGERPKRAFTYKAFNRMIQGSAARQMKKAMVQIYRTGFLPLLQIHDELAFSLKNPEDSKICAEIMEHAMPEITVPMPTDVKLGASWGEAKT